MRPAASRLALALVSGLLAAAPAFAAETPVRATPMRPGSTATEQTAPPASAPAPRPPKPRPPAPTPRPPPVALVGASEIAAKLGLKGAWLEEDRRMAFTARNRRLVLEADSREAEIDGLRVFLGSPVVLRQGQLHVSATDFRGVLVPILRPAIVPDPPAKPRVVVLDPGHGGADNGMENRKLRLKEKELALDVARRLETILAKRGLRVVLTRTGDDALASDKKTDFRRRAEVANRAKADLFVSIHFNSLYPDTKTSGTEVYVFTRAGQRSDRAAGIGEDDDTERDLSPVNRHDAWSSALAHDLHREVIAGLGTLDRGHKTMHAAVLRYLDCPAVLVESLFLSNDTEARRAATSAYRQKIAEALAAGIGDYVATLDSLRPPARN